MQIECSVARNIIIIRAMHLYVFIHLINFITLSLSTIQEYHYRITAQYERNNIQIIVLPLASLHINTCYVVGTEAGKLLKLPIHNTENRKCLGTGAISTQHTFCVFLSDERSYT